MDDLQNRLTGISLVICDVDGVLTDSRIGYDANGIPYRMFHTRDVTGMTLWRLAGGRVALLSGLGCKAIEALAATWKCVECHMWIKDKGRVCREIAQRQNVRLQQVAFLGDDMIDVAAMRLVGLAAAVADAQPEAKAAAHLVTEARGGEGALRELVERILAAQGRLKETVEVYCSRKDGTQ